VKEGDVVTIITDDRRKPEAEMVANVVAERGGLPVVANNETQVRRALADTHFPWCRRATCTRPWSPRTRSSS
jgi:hypothetical protein